MGLRADYNTAKTGLINWKWKYTGWNSEWEKQWILYKTV